MIDTEENRRYLRDTDVARRLDAALYELLKVRPPQPLPFLAEQLCPEMKQRIAGLKAEIEDLETPNRVLTILHFNDVYHVEPWADAEPVGGAARFHTLLRKIQEEKDIMVMFSGDFMGPSVTSAATKGRHMIECLNRMNTDYGVFGNHEFDYGLDILKKLVHGSVPNAPPGTSVASPGGNKSTSTTTPSSTSTSTTAAGTTVERQGTTLALAGETMEFAGSETTWIMSNMFDAETGQPLGDVEPWVLERWQGVMLGIIGLCENWLPFCGRIDQSKVRYEDLYQTGERLARELKAKGAEFVIALTHSRFEVDKELASKAPTIDLILGGHDHFYKDGLRDHRLIKSGQEFQWLSEITVEFPPKGKPIVSLKTHEVTSEFAPNTEMEKLVDLYADYIKEKMARVYCQTSVELDSREECLRFGEGSLGNWIADVLAEECGAQVAVVCGASIGGKKVTPPGDLTQGTFFEWFPSEASAMVLDVTGLVLLKLLEQCAKKLPGECGNFAHCHGVTQTIDVGKAWDGGRVHDVQVQGQPLDAAKRYTVAVTDFVGKGSGPFGFLKDKAGGGVRVVVEDEYAIQIVDHLKTWCKKKNIPTIAPSVGRVKLILPPTAAH
eukprot:TRINITY_DN349_c0_g1_i15.p1 TRINITY_DN349_c0_g1~~TRINITY_DN349_c0_g1_i15.p1  ORF type:complete len:609 (+),score=140.26 TRINITY_DN349_c0_g1_i15:1102-2928(+)